MIVSVEEARELLGKDAEGMTDEQVIEVIHTLDAIAVEALRNRTERMKTDALALAELIYDIYQDKKKSDQMK